MLARVMRTICFAIVIEIMLAIVFLVRNVTALHVLGVLQPRAFMRCDFAVGLGLVLHGLHMRLTFFETCRFLRGEGAGLHALVDTLLLILLPLIDVGRVGLRQNG